MFLQFVYDETKTVTIIYPSRYHPSQVIPDFRVQLTHFGTQCQASPIKKPVGWLFVILQTGGHASLYAYQVAGAQFSCRHELQSTMQLIDRVAQCFFYRNGIRTTSQARR